MARELMVDEQSYELALYFLPPAATPAMKMAMAQDIQQAVEDFCDEHAVEITALEAQQGTRTGD